jgi:hypothetical protein
MSADHEPRLRAQDRVCHRRRADVFVAAWPGRTIAATTERPVADDNVGVGRHGVDLGGEERLAIRPSGTPHASIDWSWLPATSTISSAGTRSSQALKSLAEHAREISEALRYRHTAGVAETAPAG